MWLLVPLQSKYSKNMGTKLYVLSLQIFTFLNNNADIIFFKITTIQPHGGSVKKMNCVVVVVVA